MTTGNSGLGHFVSPCKKLLREILGLGKQRKLLALVGIQFSEKTDKVSELRYGPLLPIRSEAVVEAEAVTLELPHDRENQ